MIKKKIFRFADGSLCAGCIDAHKNRISIRTVEQLNEMLTGYHVAYCLDTETNKMVEVDNNFKEIVKS